MEDTKNWKFHVLCHCPFIKKFDSVVVTKEDLMTASTYKNIYLTTRSPSPTRERR